MKPGNPDTRPRGESQQKFTVKLEADASAGYREEYAHQGVDADLRPDGGRGYQLPAQWEHVVDREDDDPNAAIVLKVHTTATAREHYIEEIDATVAEVNPEYDPLAPVVTVAYVDDLEDERRPGEELGDVLVDGGRDAPRYTFPAPRLREVNREVVDL